ncbi:MAG TPA: sigma-70 family RNA polymerase sigma factor [Roseiarcus sp.]|nr:sigma-70 family RNA polymerase sigma factor [Roseiarcus sp.]
MSDAEAAERFVDLVAPHLDEAFALAKWLTGNRADAEDVVQDACVRALGALSGGAVEKPRPWLLAITRNAAHTFLKRNRSRTVVASDDLEALESASLAEAGERPASPEEALIAAADSQAVEQAIRDLPSAYREVIVMRDINGLSYREISEAIEAPIGTVMSRLARGRAALIDKLGRRR